MTRLAKAYFLDSEYKPLRCVLLYKPGPEIGRIPRPQEVLHLKKIDYGKICGEYEEIIRLYKRFKIKVHLLKPLKSKSPENRYLFNLMYTRDLLFMSPAGAIISRMCHGLRREETKQAETFLKRINIPIRNAIGGKGTFEGADALWVNKKLVMVGVGRRTNQEGFRQIKEALKSQGVSCISVAAPKGTLHLLGALQFVDSDLALVRTELVNTRIIGLLKENKIKLVNIPENTEVRNRQAMNIVAIAPKKIIMPAGCPKTRKIYESYGIKIAALVRITQLINGGGGLACAAAVIKREAK